PVASRRRYHDERHTLTRGRALSARRSGRLRPVRLFMPSPLFPWPGNRRRLRWTGVSPPGTDVGKRALIALRWAAAARLAGQALSWIVTVVVIRLLSPADYGLLAMAVILPTTLYLINDLGLDVVLVQNQAPDPA